MKFKRTYDHIHGSRYLGFWNLTHADSGLRITSRNTRKQAIALRKELLAARSWKVRWRRLSFPRTKADREAKKRVIAILIWP